MAKGPYPNRIFEVSIRAKTPSPGVTGILRIMLENSGIKPSEIIETNDESSDTLTTYLPSLRLAQSLKKRLAGSGLKKITVRTGMLRRDDWLLRWKKDWKPFTLTPSLDVVPVWCRRGYHPKNKDFILLDTISSFGTGLHETTRFVSEFIESQCGRFETFFDVGTGTGILALVAFKCGARKILAVDYDQQSIRAAKANLSVNNCRICTVRHSDIKTCRVSVQFDFVAANLVTRDLVDYGEKIAGFVRPGGHLAVSGISLPNWKEFSRAFRRLPLQCVTVKKGETWAAALFQKKGR